MKKYPNYSVCNKFFNSNMYYMLNQNVALKRDTNGVTVVLRKHDYVYNYVFCDYKRFKFKNALFYQDLSIMFLTIDVGTAIAKAGYQIKRFDYDKIEEIIKQIHYDIYGIIPNLKRLFKWFKFKLKDYYE